MTDKFRPDAAAEGQIFLDLDVARGFYVNFGKRLFDLVLAILILPIVAPIIVCLWIIVRFDGGPGFFAHERVGRNGKKFTGWKLRSMDVNAAELLSALLAADNDAAEQWQRNFKLDDDPRVTRLGRIMRKTSLDELPQIWNVLKGEMSFVGPRPVVEDEIAKFGIHRQKIADMSPGITGPWQVSDRNNVAYQQRVMMDVLYYDQAGFLFDLKVIFKTVAVVLRCTGK